MKRASKKSKQLKTKKFDKKAFIYWAKKARIVIERVAKEKEKNENSANFAF